MTNKAYLLRAVPIALLLWGSVLAVLYIGRRPAPEAPAATPLVEASQD